MKQSLIGILFFLTPFTAQALASLPRTAVSCEDKLKQSELAAMAGEKAFLVSDIEQLFLEIVQATAEITKAEPEQVVAKANDLLNLKAYWLNQVTSLIINTRSDNELPIKNLYVMIETIGIPSQPFRRPANIKPVPPRPVVVIRPLRPAPAQNPIGFLHFADSGSNETAAMGFVHFAHTGPDESAAMGGSHRSIGFKEFEWIAPDVPARIPNQIALMAAPKAVAVVIADLQLKKFWAIRTDILTTTGFSDGHYESQIIFNQDIAEWIVLRKNLSNETGQMGFGADFQGQ